MLQSQQPQYCKFDLRREKNRAGTLRTHKLRGAAEENYVHK